MQATSKQNVTVLLNLTILFRVAKEYLKFDTYETGYRYTVKVLREQKILNREPYQDETYLPHYTVLEVLKKEKL